MASQRLSIATLSGIAADVCAERIESWRSDSAKIDTASVDRFCEAIRANATSLSIVYFAEWIDRWLMGDAVPGPNAISGKRFEVTCFTRECAIEWADRCGSQFHEQLWLAARLREAAAASEGLFKNVLVVVIREVFDASATDDEIKAASAVVPSWLSEG